MIRPWRMTVPFFEHAFDLLELRIEQEIAGLSDECGFKYGYCRCTQPEPTMIHYRMVISISTKQLLMRRVRGKKVQKDHIQQFPGDSVLKATPSGSLRHRTTHPVLPPFVLSSRHGNGYSANYA